MKNRSGIWFGLGLTVGTAFNFYVIVPLLVACGVWYGLGYVAGYTYQKPKKIAYEPPSELPSMMDVDYYSGRGFNRKEDR